MTVKQLTALIYGAGPDREVVVECDGKQSPVVVASLPYIGPVVLKPGVPIVNSDDSSAHSV